MTQVRRPPLKAAGKNDVWFALFFIAAILVAGLIPRHDDTAQTDRPAPVATSKE